MSGRPELYKEKYCEDIVNFMADGKSITAFAVSIGHHRQIIYEWAKKHPEFQDAIKRGIELAEAYWEDKLENASLISAQHTNTTAMIFLMKARFKTYREQLDVFDSEDPYEEPESFQKDDPDTEDDDLDANQNE